MNGFLNVDGFKIAYTKIKGKKPLTIISMHGLLSAQTFPKVMRIKQTAKALGVDFISFDFPAHGRSSGQLHQWRLGACLRAAEQVVAQVADKNKPILLTGNSMGGWIAFLLAEKCPAVKGVIGISTGIDFTDFIWKKWLPIGAKMKLLFGQTLGPGPETKGYCFSWPMFRDAKQYFLLNRRVAFDGRVVLFQGESDKWAPWPRTIRLMQNLTSENVRLYLIKGGTHLLGRPEDLNHLSEVVCLVAQEILDAESIRF